jgi:hypothetical protein
MVLGRSTFGKLQRQTSGGPPRFWFVWPNQSADTSGWQYNHFDRASQPFERNWRPQSGVVNALAVDADRLDDPIAARAQWVCFSLSAQLVAEPLNERLAGAINIQAVTGRDH